VARLEATLGAMADAVDDPQPSATQDARLHAVIARASRNPVLFDLVDRLAALAALSRSITSVDDAVRRHTLDEARELVAAIRDRDPARAESAMREHLHFVRASAQPLSAAPSRRRRPAQRR
jgi:GntR family transcriptional repressor for pyruvate dehydrogenase complex